MGGSKLFVWKISKNPRMFDRVSLHVRGKLLTIHLYLENQNISAHPSETHKSISPWACIRSGLGDSLEKYVNQCNCISQLLPFCVRLRFTRSLPVFQSLDLLRLKTPCAINPDYWAQSRYNCSFGKDLCSHRTYWLVDLVWRGTSPSDMRITSPTRQRWIRRRLCLLPVRLSSFPPFVAWELGYDWFPWHHRDEWLGES